MNLKQLKALTEKATPGKWFWNVNEKSHDMSLVSTGKGRWNETVMTFRRWGMGSAKAVFCSNDGLLEDSLDHLAIVPGHEHHADWLKTIDHRDANFIAASRTALPELISWVERARNLLQDYGTRCDVPGCDGPLLKSSNCSLCERAEQLLKEVE